MFCDYVDLLIDLCLFFFFFFFGDCGDTLPFDTPPITRSQIEPQNSLKQTAKNTNAVMGPAQVPSLLPTKQKQKKTFKPVSVKELGSRLVCASILLTHRLLPKAQTYIYNDDYDYFLFAELKVVDDLVSA